MSGSYRGPITSFVRIAFAAIVTACIIGLVWTVSAQQERDRVEAEHATSDYAKSAKEQIDNRCLRLATPRQTDCIFEEIKSSREDQRAEYDLIAQNQAARWTAIAGGAAALGLLVSIIGVALVYITFSEQRAANKLAREDADAAEKSTLEALKIAKSNAAAAKELVRVSFDTAEKQIRAYITVERITIEGVALNGKPTVTLCLCNKGQTPAWIDEAELNVRVKPVSFESAATPIFSPVENESSQSIIGAGGSHLQQSTSPEKLDADLWAAVNAGEMAIYAFGFVRYRDVYMQVHHTHYRLTCDRSSGYGKLHFSRKGNYAS